MSLQVNCKLMCVLVGGVVQVEQQYTQLEMVQHKNMVLLEENKQLQHKLDVLHR